MYIRTEQTSPIMKKEDGNGTKNTVMYNTISGKSSTGHKPGGSVGKGVSQSTVTKTYI